ncbi:MAG: hypothetical protein AAF438_02420 [Pseudomonadota bacterium]
MKRILCTLTCFGLALSGWAQDEIESSKHPYAILAGIDIDDEGALGFQGAVSYGLLERTWLSGSAGTTQSPDDQTGLNIVSAAVDIDHQFRSGFGVSGEVEYWGDSDALSRNGVAAKLYYNGGDWRLGVEVGRRDYDVTITLPQLVDTREVGFDSDSFGAFYRYSNDVWGFGVSGRSYDYSVNTRLLNTPFAVERLGLSALTLADSLLDQDLNVSIHKKLKGSRLIELSYSVSESAVDGRDSDIIGLAIVTPVGDRTDLEINFGSAQTDGSENSLFGGVLLTFYGG